MRLGRLATLRRTILSITSRQCSMCELAYAVVISSLMMHVRAPDSSFPSIFHVVLCARGLRTPLEAFVPIVAFGLLCESNNASLLSWTSLHALLHVLESIPLSNASFAISNALWNVLFAFLQLVETWSAVRFH